MTNDRNDCRGRCVKRGLLILLVACCAICTSMTALAAPPAAVDIATAVGRVPVWPGMRIVAPADIQLAPDQAAALAAGSTATIVDHPNRIFGRGTVPFWALFSLRNPESSEQLRMLAVETTTQLDMRLFERSATGAWRQVESLAEAAQGRVGGGTPHPVWALRLAAGQTTELLLRIEGPAVVRFPVFAHLPTTLNEHERNLSIVTGIALGACLFIMIYTVSLRRFLDDAAIPLFVYMIIAELLGALWLSGFLGELFPSVSERILSPVGFAAYAILYGCGCLHARICLNCTAWAPGIGKSLRMLGRLWLALAPWFSVAFPVAARILLVWGGAAVALTLVITATLAAKNRVPFSRFIAAAWLVYLISGLVFVLARVIPDPLIWSSSAMVLVQTTVAAGCFGFGTSQRLLRQRDVLVMERQDALLQRQQGAALMRERSLLFAATNHDLRQPLLGVSLFADLLRSAATQAEREEYARKMNMALKEVDELLVGIQQLSAVHEASHQLALESVRLDDLLAPIVEEYRGRSENKRITIRYVPSRLSVTTHAPYFQRIVRNILSNAVRYSERGGRILIGCRRGGGLRLAILDTGRGMTEEQTTRAFDAFQRFDPGMSIPEGFGLGLFSTRSLANALGLAISLKSREGHGTEFGIFLRARSDASE
jgi:signal transduction histidine kinase